jgi:tetratricopeptide (TPR) repeat protein
MRILHIACLLMAVLGLSAPALSDQTDTRLSALFDDLRQAGGPAEAAPVEQQIWSIWLETTDETVAALLDTGVEAMAQANFSDALKAFDEIVGMAPGFAEGWNKRATVHYLMGNLQDSLQDIGMTLELEPRHFGALSGRGLVYIKLDDLQNALTSFEEALDVHPQMTGPKVNAEAIRSILKQRDI